MSLDHAILGVISLYPCSGYDIKVDFENGSAGLVSSLSFGTIYPRLKHLENTGLIETHQIKTTGRLRKLYELTGAGWQALADSLIQPAGYPIPMSNDLLLKMIFWGAANSDDRETLIEHLQLHQAESLELLDYIAKWIENGVLMIDEYGMLVLTYVRARLDAELVWIDATITQLEGPPQPPVQDPQGLVEQQRERRAAALANM